MTDIAVQQSDELVDPRTGELVSDPPRVAALYRYFKEQRGALWEQMQVAEWLLIQEAERQGAKTFRLGDLEVEVRDDREIVWDMEILGRLREKGLPETRWNDLVEQVVTEKVKANVAKQIAGANPEYADVIGKARRDVEKARRVYVR